MAKLGWGTCKLACRCSFGIFCEDMQIVSNLTENWWSPGQYLIERGHGLTYHMTSSTKGLRCAVLQGLLCIHCAAMQGRVDVISLLQQADTEGLLSRALAEEEGTMPPSVVHLAVANDCAMCAEW